MPVSQCHDRDLHLFMTWNYHVTADDLALSFTWNITAEGILQKK